MVETAIRAFADIPAPRFRRRGTVPQDLDAAVDVVRRCVEADGDLQVSVVVLSAQESEALFGSDIAGKGVQPVWVRIRNNDPVPYWLYAIALDPA